MRPMRTPFSLSLSIKEKKEGGEGEKKNAVLPYLLPLLLCSSFFVSNTLRV